MQCQKADVPALALGLHHWLARWILNQAQAYRRSTVVLSGGCFTNQILTRLHGRSAAAQRLHRLYRLQGAPR